MIRSYLKHKPRIHAQSFLHPACEIIGDVTLGSKVSIWPMAVLRGDVDAVRVGSLTNVQDNAVLHCREGQPAVIGKGVTIGHGAIVHGARIGDGCLIGMGAIVMESRIGAQCLIAAGAMVPKGLSIKPRSLVMGFPARAVRTLNAAELDHLRRSAIDYWSLAMRHRSSIGRP